MKKYDVIVIGSGAGASIVEHAVEKKLKVAFVDKGPAGGTCLNVGCIPSKMLTAVADRIIEIRESEKFGVKAEIKKINFEKIIKDMRNSFEPIHEEILKTLRNAKNFDFYEGVGEFTEDYILKIGNEKIHGKKIFIASGARPLIPKIKGINKIDYLTNETILELKKIPKSMVIIGGSYIATEYAHFFSAIGTKVIILQRNKKLVPEEEPEVSELLKEEFEKRMKIYLGIEVIEVRKSGDSYVVIGKEKNKKNIIINTEEILVAAGRESNADLLKVENSGIDVDEKDYIKVNEFFETSKKNIWAFGDAIGKAMFTHASRYEAEIAWNNAMHEEKTGFDFDKVPHAVFTYPAIASVGLKEEDAKKKYNIVVGKADYKDIAKGEALRENGFAKAIINREDGRVLGFHIIGSFAPTLIQEVVNIIENNENINFIMRSMHIHPALSELIQAAFGNLDLPKN